VSAKTKPGLQLAGLIGAAGVGDEGNGEGVAGGCAARGGACERGWGTAGGQRKSPSAEPVRVFPRWLLLARAPLTHAWQRA
jgi:hypothetical protein